jgi:glycosyltransferase involved in cell wall biosynthesis
MALNSSPKSEAAMKLLAVSFFYPPFAYPRSVQVARLLRHADASTVLVCADEEGGRKDLTLEPGAEEFLAACLRVPFRAALWRRQVSRVASRFRLPLWNKTPDAYRHWNRSALAALADFRRESSYAPDALVTFGQPMSGHLMGLELHRRHGWPWAAHFSDPWVDNPFGRFDRLTKRFNAALERKVMEAATRLIFTSEETLDLVMAKYPGEWRTRARILPHAFEPRWYAKAAAPSAGPKVVLRYLGELYGRRSPRPLLDALRLINSSDPASLEDVCVEFVGGVEEGMISGGALAGLPPGLVEIRPVVAYQESLSLMAASDGLLVIDAPMRRSVFLPSKLIDYIGAGRPLLGITPPGTSAALIRELGGTVVDPSDPEAVASALTAFLASLREARGRESAPWGEPAVRARYEAAQVAGAFDRIIGEML